MKNFNNTKIATNKEISSYVIKTYEKFLKDNKNLIELDLDLPSHFDLSKIKLPETLQTLRISNNNKKLSNLILPKKLKVLMFGEYFSSSLDNLKLPDTLEALIFGEYFTQPIDNVKLPNSLKFLDFGNIFNQPLDNVDMPYNLKFLSLINYYHPLDYLPESLEYLFISRDYEHENINLPKKASIHLVRGRRDDRKYNHILNSILSDN